MPTHDDPRRHWLRVSLGALLLAAACALRAAPPGGAHIPSDGDRLPKDVPAAPAVAAQCMACHGPNGHSEYADWPNLAGQKEHYLLVQLQAYKSGERKHPMMQPAIAPLTAADLPKLAAYFSIQHPAEPAAGGAAKAPASAALCLACHDNPALPDPPHLRAQKADYLARQLRAFRDGTRKSAVMAVPTRSLTDKTIDELAAYLGALPPLQATAAK